MKPYAPPPSSEQMLALWRQRLRKARRTGDEKGTIVAQQAVWHRVDAILTWHHAAPAKILFVYAAAFGYRPAKQKVIEAIYSLIQPFVGAGESEDGETIEAIPTAELVDYLFTRKSFKRDDV